MKKIIHKLTNWEAWPFKLIYAPLAPMWVYYMLRSRAVWFFTSSNPKITFGGMDGEPKREMYDLLLPSLYPNTINILPDEDFNEVITKIKMAGLQFPIIVKPDIGCQGILFRKIDTAVELENYHTQIPVEYVAQEMVNYPMEVSVFYIRHPKQLTGKVTGFLHKISLHVIGDGVKHLEELIHSHPKASKHKQAMLLKHKDHLNRVLSESEKYVLNYAANHNRGAQFVDLKNHIDDSLVNIFDEVSLRINDFFYGRYDIMCESIEDLKQGKNFTILEYNGCGAEPNHFYDTGYTLMGAYREILNHWKDLYQISKYNSKQGIKPWPFLKGYKFLNKTKAHFEKMREVDATIG